MATTKDRMDPLWRQAADLVVKQGVGSTSLVQRGLRVGHTRASAIMEHLEAMGVVGPHPGGARPRPVLARDAEELSRLLARRAGAEPEARHMLNSLPTSAEARKLSADSSLVRTIVQTKIAPMIRGAASRGERSVRYMVDGETSVNPRGIVPSLVVALRKDPYLYVTRWEPVGGVYGLTISW